MGGMPSHTLCRWRGNASMLIEAYIHSPCAEWGYELDKITRLQRSRLHSGVKAHRGGADESAFTHTAAPCEGPLAALPRHLAVILLARLQRRTSVIFGSVSYAFQPQKPSEGDQKNGQETGVVEASNTKRLQLGVDRGHVGGCQPTRGSPTSPCAAGNRVELGCPRPFSTVSHPRLGQLTALQEGYRHVRPRRGGRGETAWARVAWKQSLRLIFVFVREHHTVSDAPGSSETDRPTLEWHPCSAALMLYRHRATIHTWQRSILGLEEMTWAAGALWDRTKPRSVGQCTMTNAVGLARRGKLREDGHGRSITSPRSVALWMSDAWGPPAATRLANPSAFRQTFQMVQVSACLCAHLHTSVERCSGGNQWTNGGDVGAYTPADGSGGGGSGGGGKLANLSSNWRLSSCTSGHRCGCMRIHAHPVNCCTARRVTA